MNLFKLGVSNWHFVIDSGYEFDCKNVISEKITTTASGRYKIVLKSATFDIENWNKLLGNPRIERITQNFNLRNELGQKQPDFEMSYLNGVMIKYVQESVTNEVGTFTVKIQG